MIYLIHTYNTMFMIFFSPLRKFSDIREFKSFQVPPQMQLYLLGLLGGYIWGLVVPIVCDTNSQIILHAYQYVVTS
jgi:hypothetical protein